MINKLKWIFRYVPLIYPECIILTLLKKLIVNSHTYNKYLSKYLFTEALIVVNVVIY